MRDDDPLCIRAFELQPDYDLFELLIEKIYEKFLKPGDCAIDGGCNTGRHTIPLANIVGLSGRVIGFEPIPILAKRLQAKMAELPQLQIHNKAISAAPGHSTFEVFPGRMGWSSLRTRSDAPDLDRQVIDVEVTTINSLPSSALAKLRFIKLDIEGAELDAMRGAKCTIALLKPMIIFENGGLSVAKRYGYPVDMEDWFGFFQSCGYVVFDIIGRPYTRSFWQALERAPWNSIAVAEDSQGARFMQDEFPALLQATMSGCR